MINWNGKWYRYLNRANSKSLLADIDDSYQLIVCKINSRGYRNYAAFADVSSFYQYLCQHPDLTEYHEVIRGDLPQKPHFDIDLTPAKSSYSSIEGLGSKIIISLLASIIRALSSRGHTLNPEVDVGIYKSQDDGQRFSYHVVVHSYYHANYLEAEKFYWEVTRDSGDPLLEEAFNKKVIDPSMYRVTCCFRMLGSTKNGQRPKLPTDRSFGQLFRVTAYPDLSDPQVALHLLKQSVITHTQDCLRISIE